VRTVVYRGPFLDLLAELAAQEHFRELVKLQAGHQQDGTAEEIVLRFFAYLDWQDRFDGRVTSFLNEYVRDHRNATDLKERRDLFDRVIDHLVQVGPVPFLRENYHSTPINQFEAALVACGQLIREGASMAATAQLGNDEILKQSSTGGTNTRQALRGRIERARELLLQ
jgi:hypothetical protein